MTRKRSAACSATWRPATWPAIAPAAADTFGRQPPLEIDYCEFRLSWPEASILKRAASDGIILVAIFSEMATYYILSRFVCDGMVVSIKVILFHYILLIEL
jgi:hypothetical protein